MIGFGAGKVTYTYRAAAQATTPPPTFEQVPAPSGFDQPVTAPEPPPGGEALITSPSIAAAGAVGAPSAVSADVSGLSVRATSLVERLPVGLQ